MHSFLSFAVWDVLMSFCLTIEQFVSRTMRYLTDMPLIAYSFSSRYHPQSNGVIEDFHNSFKQMLAQVIAMLCFPRTVTGTYKQSCSHTGKLRRKVPGFQVTNCVWRQYTGQVLIVERHLSTYKRAWVQDVQYISGSGEEAHSHRLQTCKRKSC